MYCSICGMPMAHYRLYGYRCNNPEHHELANDPRQCHYCTRCGREIKNVVSHPICLPCRQERHRKVDQYREQAQESGE